MGTFPFIMSFFLHITNSVHQCFQMVLQTGLDLLILTDNALPYALPFAKKRANMINFHRFLNPSRAAFLILCQIKSFS